MKVTRFISTLLLVCGLSLTTNVTATVQENNIIMPGISNAQLREFHETTDLAEKIWNRLTSEFVTQFEASQYIEAAVTAKIAVDLAERNFGVDHINTADSLLKLGIASESLGNFTAAREHMIGALVILEEQLGSMHEDVSVVYTNLANLEFEQNNPSASETYHKKALKIRVYQHGKHDPTVAQSLYNLAVLYDDKQDYKKAQYHYETALKIWTASYGSTHPYIANTLNNLANVYAALGDNDSAIKMHKQSLSVRKKLYGSYHTEVARSLINLGKLYVKINAYEKAKPIYTEAVNVAENLFGSTHPQVAMLLYSLANIYHIQGRMDSKKAAPRKVSMTTKHDKNLNNDQNETVLTQEYYQKALPLYERALNILDQTIGTDHPAVVAMMGEMAMLYKSIGNRGKADKMQARMSNVKEYKH
ncbi:MAG: tetratricopeptide repeat protein [Thiohalomonadales bacterium]